MSYSLFLPPFILPSLPFPLLPPQWNLVDQLEAHCNIYWFFAWTDSIEDTHLDEQLGDHQSLKKFQAHFWVWLCSESYKGLRQFGTISRKFSEAQVTCPEEKNINFFPAHACFTLKVNNLSALVPTPFSFCISFQSNILGTFLL